MGQMMKLLKEKDPVLHKHLVSACVHNRNLCFNNTPSHTHAHSKRLAWILPSLDFVGLHFYCLRNFCYQVNLCLIVKGVAWWVGKTCVTR